MVYIDAILPVHLRSKTDLIHPNYNGFTDTSIPVHSTRNTDVTLPTYNNGHIEASPAALIRINRDVIHSTWDTDLEQRL
jgi:hypothetical protein